LFFSATASFYVLPVWCRLTAVLPVTGNEAATTAGEEGTADVTAEAAVAPVAFVSSIAPTPPLLPA